MGESYYLRKNICPHCGRYDEIHVGMANLGWKFVFHVDEEHKNFSDWYKEFVPSNQIFDEYGRHIDTYKFLEMIKEMRSNDSRSSIDGKITTDGDYDYKEGVWE